LQAAIYTDGAAHIFGTNRVEFLFVAVEKTPPFGVGIYELTGDDLMKAWDEYQKHLAVFARCKATGIWPGYEPKLTKLVLPAWLYASGEGEQITLDGELVR
jgi:exodeoxyribonuclease VIII